ncbi:MAG: type IX secretion system sortase PorU, partial [Bacteroidales bacterium]
MNAQNYNYFDNIKWKGIQKIQIDSVNSFERLAFMDAVYYKNRHIPVCHHVLKPENVKLTDFEWENKTVKKLSEEEQLFLKRHNIELPDKFDVRFSHSIIRKKQYAHINITPLRQNPKTGEPEKLIEFGLKINYEETSELKSQRNYADNSVMDNGDWYKIRVGQPGVYKLTYNSISSMGFDDPAQVGVFGYGNMVPKRNDEQRYDDLPQRPVYLKDNNGNGDFDEGDAILFYLEGPNAHEHKGDGEFRHEIHNYSDHSYYFLSDAAGPEYIQTVNESLTANKSTSSYDYYKTLEKDSINIIGTGRTWYWRHFDYYPSYTFNIGIPDLNNNEPAVLYSSLAGRSSVSNRFKFTINGNVNHTGYIDEVSGAYGAPYAKTLNAQFDISNPQSTNTIKVEYLFPNTNSEGWLDYLTINARSWLNLQSNSLKFRDSRTVGSGNVTQYTIDGINNSCKVLDITDPANAFEIEADEITGGQLKFTAESEQLREFIVFDAGASYDTPQFDDSDKLGFVSNQNLHGLSNVDFVIVTNSLFASYADQLAGFHQSLNGLNTIVVDQENVFNEFSSGTPDVAAVRDFMKMLYDKAGSESEMPKYLLLFGDGSYDNKTTSSPNSNYILTYQSKTSLSPARSFVSDDFYGLLDDNEGTVSGSEGLDIGIGRLPVKTQEEAQHAIDKIFNYVNPDSFGQWRNVMAFIGDDAEDTSTHQAQANEMGDTIMSKQPVFNVDKILLDAYEQVSTVQGDRYPDVNQTIDERVNKGALIMNYSGHGNEKSLAHEAVVTISQINSWENFNRLPVFITATCEFSRFDDYEFTSGGEQIFLNPEGGGIALFTTSRLVYSGANFNLNKEFYRQAFKRDANNELYALGENIMHTKNNTGDSNNKRNFTLLGDPAMKLAIPEYIVKTDSVNGVDISVFTDTVGAASHITVTGHIEDRDGNIRTDFNGILYPRVYDKVMEYSTLGNDDNPPFPYKEQKNILYSGKSSINDGYFSFEFIVPVDIAYYFDNG